MVRGALCVICVSVCMRVWMGGWAGAGLALVLVCLCECVLLVGWLIVGLFVCCLGVIASPIGCCNRRCSQIALPCLHFLTEMARVPGYRDELQPGLVVALSMADIHAGHKQVLLVSF